MKKNKVLYCAVWKNNGRIIQQCFVKIKFVCGIIKKTYYFNYMPYIKIIEAIIIYKFEINFSDTDYI